MAAHILEMDAIDLIGRLVVNPNGHEFVVRRLKFEARSGQVIFMLQDTDGDDAEFGLPNLDEWDIHQKLREEE